MKSSKCPSCNKFTVTYDPSIRRVRCYSKACSWAGSGEVIYVCPVCQSTRLRNVDLSVMEALDDNWHVHTGCSCLKCGSLFYWPAHAPEY